MYIVKGSCICYNAYRQKEITSPCGQVMNPQTVLQHSLGILLFFYSGKAPTRLVVSLDFIYNFYPHTSHTVLSHKPQMSPYFCILPPPYPVLEIPSSPQFPPQGTSFRGQGLPPPMPAGPVFRIFHLIHGMQSGYLSLSSK